MERTSLPERHMTARLQSMTPLSRVVRGVFTSGACLHRKRRNAHERHWRDKGQWENMRSAYHPESIVRLAWFQGTGFEFVEASNGIHHDGQSKHRLSPTVNYQQLC